MKVSTTAILVALVLFIGSVNSQFTKYRAKDYITNASAYAQNNYSPNAAMYAITSLTGLDTTGKSATWLYWFYKPNVTDTSYVVTVTVISPFPPILLGSSAPSVPGAMLRPVGTNFCNSDESIIAAENAGGRLFRLTHPGTRISASVNKLPVVPDTSRAYWTYLYTDTMGTEFRTFFVDGVTCQIITIGIQNTSKEIPENFDLLQNYPNPFNPSTKIKFSVPKAGFVTLTVYNAAGSEVEKLVSDMLTAGVYEADFDASDYSSGIYFYKLESNDFSQTRKMMLIK